MLIERRKNMSKKVFVVPWIFVVSFAVHALSETAAESAVQISISANKLIPISLSFEQSALKLKISASGTPIGDGVVITNRHVFKSHAELQKAGFDMTQPVVSTLVGCYAKTRALRFALKLKKLGAEDDVAILQADLQGVHNTMANTPWYSKEHRDIVALYALLTKGIPIATEELSADDPLYLTGFPFGGPLVVNAGALFHSSSSAVLCRGNAEYGMSGGGILNQNGALVGFVARKKQDFLGDLIEGPAVSVLEKFK